MKPVFRWIGGPSLRKPLRAGGFTLLELLIVVAIMALATAGVGLAMRDSSSTQLEREAQRLAALLESGRAQSRMSANPVRWRVTATGFSFDGLVNVTLPSNWLGNDVPTPVSEVGTYRCRALHSNHLKGHVWEEFGSETYRARPAVSPLPGGGRGYYRNVSLLNVWAHAPFLHNFARLPFI